jgi:hypothetical protein
MLIPNWNSTNKRNLLQNGPFLTIQSMDHRAID